MTRKPFIKPRSSARDKTTCSGGSRTAEIGAGDQCLILSVGPHPDRGRDGAKVDLSWAEADQPLLVCVNLDKVSVPTCHFDHGVEGHRSYLFAGECVRALAKIHCLMDGTEWSPDTLDAIADALRSASLLVREPDEDEE